jgi:uncharacterized integral membrane protein
VKILRIMLAVVLFVAGVFLATANMHEVDVFLPALPIAGWPELRQVRVPLFLVVLGSLIAGVLLMGLWSLFEQIRWRTGARRAAKEHKRAQGAREAAENERDSALRERDIARGELVQVRAEAAEARRERDAVRGELKARASSQAPSPPFEDDSEEPS